MGILDYFGFTPGANSASGIKSPFTDSSLQQVVWSDIFGADFEAPLGRAEAMAVPAISKARQLITGTISRLPLRVLDASGELPDLKQPAWTYRTDGTVSPYLRMAWTLDDVLFYGASLWSVDRGSDGQIIRAERVPFEWWQVTPEGAILIQDQAVNASSVLYFPGSIEGLLDRGQSAIKSARAIEKAVERRASSPIPVMEIHQQDGDAPLTATEAKELVTGYNKARRDPEGATVFTPSHIELKPHGDKADSGAQVEARNASRLDIANLTGVPASLLEGSMSTASLTYSTAEGRRNEFVDYALAPYMDAITSRLSMDDVVPRGQRVRFDLTDLLTTTPSPTGAPEQD